MWYKAPHCGAQCEETDGTGENQYREDQIDASKILIKIMRGKFPEENAEVQSYLGLRMRMRDVER